MNSNGNIQRDNEIFTLDKESMEERERGSEERSILLTFIVDFILWLIVFVVTIRSFNALQAIPKEFVNFDYTTSICPGLINGTADLKNTEITYAYARLLEYIYCR
jgi:hypothetical protein